MSAIDRMVRNAPAYAAAFASAHLPGAPARGLAVLACMDARLNVPLLLGLDEGDAHIIRNAGGLATDDAIRSLAVSQHALGTREVMVIHHSRCGMLGFDDPTFRAGLRHATGATPAWRIETFRRTDDAVRATLRALRACRFLPHRDAIRGFVFDVDTGVLSEVAAEPSTTR